MGKSDEIQRSELSLVQRTPGLVALLETIVYSPPPPSLWMWATGRKWSLKRVYFSDPTPGIQVSWLFIQKALEAFPAVSVMARWAAS